MVGFFPPKRLCDHLINDCHECGKAMFPIRIKIGLAFLTSAYSSECSNITMQNPRNHQSLYTWNKALHEVRENNF